MENADFPLVQTKIIDFFRIHRSSERIQKPSQGKGIAELNQFPLLRLLIEWRTVTISLFLLIYLDSRKRRRAGSLVVSKRRRKLLPFNPSEDPTRRLEQMASLATALTATGAEFSNELTYMTGMAPRSANRAALEQGGMQV